MALTVILSPQAVADLESIRDYIAETNPERADSFVEELRTATRRLSENGRRHAVVPRYETIEIRSVSYRRYLIIYRVAGDVVGVLRIVHGSRNLTRILGELG